MPYDPDDPGGFSLRSRNPETKTLQLEYWNRRSRGYNLTTLIELHDTLVCTQLISGLLPKGRRSKVCDMGTACGYAAITAAKMGHEVTAVDYSESMIDHAKYTARQERLDIKFIVADVEELSFPDESFDLIIAKSIIWCLEQPVRAIANWMRFLKPGGHILIIDGNYYLGHFEKDYAAKLHLNSITDSENKGLHGRTNMDNVDFEELHRLAKDLPACAMRRPGWDVSVLLGLGLEDVRVQSTDRDPYQTVSTAGYINLPGSFTVTARKPIAYAKSVNLSFASVKSDLVKMGDTIDHSVSLMKAIGDRNRLMTIVALANCDMNVKMIAELLGISPALASHNLKVLTESGLVSSRRNGKETVYSLSDRDRIIGFFNRLV